MAVEGKQMTEQEHEDRQHGTGHPQVHVKVGPMEADVDEQLAPLISEMWRAGVETIMSCQHHPTPEFEKSGLPTAWVWLYMYAPHAEQFCSIVAGEHDEDPNSLYQRISGDKLSDPDRNWWYDGHATNVHGEIMFDISVRFPVEDLPEVYERMRRFNAEGGTAFAEGKAIIEEALAERDGDWQQVGTVGVDAGQVLIADPCHVIPDDQYDKWMTEHDAWIEGHEVVDIDGDMVLSPTAHGDGTFPVEARFGEDGRVMELTSSLDKRERSTALCRHVQQLGNQVREVPNGVARTRQAIPQGGTS
jgi:hypothetical protein